MSKEASGFKQKNRKNVLKIPGYENTRMTHLPTKEHTAANIYKKQRLMNFHGLCFLSFRAGYNLIFTFAPDYFETLLTNCFTRDRIMTRRSPILQNIY